ncbi:MAG: type II toxin-antitoxin system VapC family toxin [Acidobacteria bacterium]|nr:type II toxin-antitoxin system VapC family toxin [Acidobacteriota bacterium]
MVIDSSAIMAILLWEPEAPLFGRLIKADPTRLISSVTSLEIALVASSRKKGGGEDWDQLRRDMDLTEVAFTAEHAEVSRRAWLRFGKGNHAARLNLADCCAYATARLAREPLLYKGDDFAKTDIRSAS